MRVKTDEDGYLMVYGVEVNGNHGMRIYMKGPQEMFDVVSYEKTRERPETFVSLPIEDMLESINRAVALRDVDGAGRQQAERMRTEMESIFTAAGVSPIHMRAIANEYCGRSCCVHKPWYVVTSKLGPIKIGWRKRVIVIDWQDSDMVLDGEALFADVDVTKGKRFIHAYGDSRASEFIKRLAIAHSARALPAQ